MIPPIDEVWALCQKIHSHGEGISYANVRDLHRAASLVKNGVIVEIGSWLGRSTVALAASAAANGNRVYAIDPWVSIFSDTLECDSDFNMRQIWQENMDRSGVAANVIPLNGSSSWMRTRWDGAGIDLLFIDGEHSYLKTEADVRDEDIENFKLKGWRINGTYHSARELRRFAMPPFGVKVDYDLWAPLVKPGGYIGFHDVGPWPDVTRVWEEEILAHPELWEAARVENILGIARRRA